MNEHSNFPQFPKFKKITIHDQKLFTSFVRSFLPYSDYNFVSLWSHNTEDDAEFSLLHNNIIIQFRDYLTHDPFYSFIGKTNVLETIQQLLIQSEKKGLPAILKLIPEVNLEENMKLIEKKFKTEIDRDSADYILSLEEASQLSGRKFNIKRNKVNRFLRDNPNATLKEIDLHNEENRIHLNYVFSRWSQDRDEDELHHEYHAIKRLLTHVSFFKLVAFGVYIKDKFEAYTIIELLPNKYAITHFTKADPKIPGIFEYLYNQVAKELVKKGYLYLNREQDLGLEGLRSAKLSWRPIKFLQKYTISRL